MNEPFRKFCKIAVFRLGSAWLSAISSGTLQYELQRSRPLQKDHSFSPLLPASQETSLETGGDRPVTWLCRLQTFPVGSHPGCQATTGACEYRVREYISIFDSGIFFPRKTKSGAQLSILWREAGRGSPSLAALPPASFIWTNALGQNP